MCSSFTTLSLRIVNNWFEVFLKFLKFLSTSNIEGSSLVDLTRVAARVESLFIASNINSIIEFIVMQIRLSVAEKSVLIYFSLKPKITSLVSHFSRSSRTCLSRSSTKKDQ